MGSATAEALAMGDIYCRSRTEGFSRLACGANPTQQRAMCGRKVREMRRLAGEE